MPQLEHIEAIEKRLWSAADNLRANSNYASNEYFLPVMGLVFLRHAYSRYLNIREKISLDLPSRGGKTRALTKEDFSQQSAIFLGPKAQFDHLVALPDSEDRAKSIIEAMESIETDYESLRGVLPLRVDELQNLYKPGFYQHHSTRGRNADVPAVQSHESGRRNSKQRKRHNLS
ncbi:MAG: type I restriction-modification system subunit M N-terminal domain-containing protein [Sedimenticola sp.]